ncbi:hypothetical protein [Ferrimicrobium sp.]|jgi:hypothetical protein|uniref:hypothetical protein n=1 Tax=Ferrimicrobium sp. TaxID=2926050 RepID=UPI0026060D50|nr:hypothetical protein [Ferrimicrobium sp.]
MSAETWTATAAVATALLAIATGYLAWKTRSMANETKGVAEATFEVAQATLDEAKAVERQSEQMERQVAVSAEALRASVQPWLVWQPSFEVPSSSAPEARRYDALYSAGSHPALDVREKDDSVTGWLTVRNVGSGLALLNMAESGIFPKNGNAAYENVHPTVISPILPPGESVDVEFTIPASQSPNRQKMTVLQFAGGDGVNELFALELAYSDSLGSGLTLAKFRAHRKESTNQPWTIFEVEYRLPNGEVVRTRRFG